MREHWSSVCWYDQTWYLSGEEWGNAPGNDSPDYPDLTCKTLLGSVLSLSLPGRAGQRSSPVEKKSEKVCPKTLYDNIWKDKGIPSVVCNFLLEFIL